MATILAIDPGTRSGWALFRGDEASMVSGYWDLKGNRFEGAGMRFVRAERYLMEIAATAAKSNDPITLIAFEEVRRHLGTDAAHIYGGIIAVIMAWCEKNKVPYQGIPVPVVKKLATGKGNANKEKMVAAAQLRWPSAGLTDDNEVDARFIALAAFKQTLIEGA